MITLNNNEEKTTTHCAVQNTLYADVKENLVMCSGMSLRRDVFVPKTVNTINSMREDWTIATIPKTSAP